MSRWPLALAAGSLLDQPAEALIEAAAAAGFSAVGLRWSGEHGAADPLAVAALAQAYDIAIHDVEVYRIAEPAADPVPLLDAAAALGAGRVLVVSDLSDREATLRGLTEVVQLAGERGLRIGLEYMAWTDPGEPLDAIGVARRTGCELVVDLLHHVRVGAGVAELDAIVASGALGWVQLCDAAGPAPTGTAGLLHEALTELLGRVPAGATISVEVQSDDLLAVAARERSALLFDTSVAVLAQSPSSTG